MVLSHPVGSGGQAESSLGPLQEQQGLLIPELALSLSSPDVALLSFLLVLVGVWWFGSV